MKEIVIISGKGGSGKTVISAALATLAKNKVMVDCDVDAADLHLLLHPNIQQTTIFQSGTTAVINQDKCTKCGLCRNLCHFDAITEKLVVDDIACEGCEFCYHACPSGAIELRDNISGEWYLSDTAYGKLVHAKLGIAEENSGKLVALIRQQAKDLAQQQHNDLVIIDGPPGVGCPVIASTVGADLAVLIVEPTLAGIHDFERVLAVTKRINLAAKVVINKYDLNEENSEKIRQICLVQDLDCIGEIPYAAEVPKSITKGKIITEILPQHEVSVAIKNIWQRIEDD